MYSLLAAKASKLVRGHVCSHGQDGSLHEAEPHQSLPTRACQLITMDAVEACTPGENGSLHEAVPHVPPGLVSTLWGRDIAEGAAVARRGGSCTRTHKQTQSVMVPAHAHDCQLH